MRHGAGRRSARCLESSSLRPFVLHTVSQSSSLAISSAIASMVSSASARRLLRIQLMISSIPAVFFSYPFLVCIPIVYIIMPAVLPWSKQSRPVF